ncbi:MAG: VTT domain-containing protein [Anaerolineales bacterium]|nr:VTT domain-containing protein [Anaerolineales bacterium]
MPEFLQQFWNALVASQGVNWGPLAYVALGLLVLVEGPIATLLGAAASSAGYMNPVGVFASASVGNLTADFLWYGLGYMGKTEWVIRHGRWLNLRRSHIERIQRDIHRHVRKVLILAKLTASMAVPALIATGLAKVPWQRWFGVVFAAEMIWTGSLVVGGYYFTRYLTQLEAGLQVVAIVSLVILIVLVGRYVLGLINEWSDLAELEKDRGGE